MLAGLSVEARTAMWAGILAGPTALSGTTAHLIEEGAGLVGFGAGGDQRDPHLRELGFDAEIGAIYLLRSHQRRGLGRRLMHAMAADLRRRGHRGAALWVLRENAAARAFCRHLGGGVVAEKADRRGAHVLTELAYGWRGLSRLANPLPAS